jgi:hypothetical protein
MGVGVGVSLGVEGGRRKARFRVNMRLNKLVSVLYNEMGKITKKDGQARASVLIMREGDKACNDWELLRKSYQREDKEWLGSWQIRVHNKGEHV